LQPGLVVDADQCSPDQCSPDQCSPDRGPPDRDLSQLPILTFRPRTDQPPRTIAPTVPTSSARSATLIRSCSVASSSSSATGTLAWATIGPASTPSSTMRTVQPVTFTPWASASRTA